MFTPEELGQINQLEIPEEMEELRMLLGRPYEELTENDHEKLEHHLEKMKAQEVVDNRVLEDWIDIESVEKV